MPTRNNVVPGNWASVLGGKWHLSAQEKPELFHEAQSLCGLRFQPRNVTWGEAPSTNDHYICKHCVTRKAAGNGSN